MPWTVMEAIITIVDKPGIKLVDITGGAPELNPNLRSFINALYRPDLNIILRTNLVALVEPEGSGLAEFFRDKRVKLVASLPCYLEENLAAQRGDNTYSKSIAALKKLNQLGYGNDAGLELNLVHNPGGPFLPGGQEELETAYRIELKKLHNITFTKLLALTNMPIGRFKSDLTNSNELDRYNKLLQDAYNQATVSELMCRSQISVGWDGTIYDCDFNLALGRPANVRKPHIFNSDWNSLGNRTIVTGEHCFGCTAGAGSSCSGALEGGVY
jgi:radical SAM/Cys-rich protein